MADSYVDRRPVLVLAAALGCAWWEAAHPCRYSVLEAASDVIADLTIRRRPLPHPRRSVPISRS
jgi:hypothetical protein